MDAFLTKQVPIERSLRVLSNGTGLIKNASISTQLWDLKVNLKKDGQQNSNSNPLIGIQGVSLSKTPHRKNCSKGILM